MSKIHIASLLIVVFVIIAGCVQPVQQLGCCIRDNATNATGGGCILYNITDYQQYNYIDQTHSCDDSTLNTSGQCNVTIGSRTQLIPICTETQFQKCISGNCIAMACGDFAYNPRIGPGFSSVEDATGNIPPNIEDEGQVANFYKARCRYIPMDEHFKQIMKNAKAQVNVFRFGVGSSFDEYEQYKDYFPLSDKFCGRNPPSSLMVDRYQNYLTSNLGIYNPVRDIQINCLNDIAYGPGSVSSPFSFEETNATVNSLSPGINDFSPLNADARGYKLAYKATVNFENATGFGMLTDQRVDISKTIDTSFYKKYLYSINANQMYGLDGSDPAKGTFECDAEGNDCYSGNCDTTKYSRGVMFSTVTPGFTPRQIASDCFKVKDSVGKERIICAPTSNIVPNGGAEGLASIDNVPVEYASAHFEAPNNGRADDWFFSDSRATIASLPMLDASSTVTSHWIRVQTDGGASYSIGPTVTSENIPIPGTGATANGPPAGGAMFFGKLNNTPMTYRWTQSNSDGTTSTYQSVVIGYALASSEAEFENMYVTRQCRLGISDYKMIEIDDPDGSAWGDLVYQFKPYINDRFNAMKTSGDNCGAYADMGDLVMSSIPWVLSYNKNNGNSDEDLRTATYLTSPIAQALRDRNILDEPMVNTQSQTACAMKSNRMVPYGDDERDWMPDPDEWRSRYNVYYSKKIFLILYTPGTNMIGNAGGCAIDNETYLPELRTYGWCESCSEATLAYQKITTLNPYQPAYSVNPQNPTTANNLDTLCNNVPDAYFVPGNCSGGGACPSEVRWRPQLNCENNKVADIKDFNGQIMTTGTPRTSPNAATVKQRLGTYMKQGVMPVLDLSDPSNWNLTYQNGTVSDGSSTTPAYANYTKYDFESLFGEMGTVVVIVDNITGTANAQKVNQIINRSSILKQKCYGCLSAIHINNPTNESEFRNSIDSVLTNPIANFNIDLVTYDYQISTHDSQFSAINNPELRSQAIAGQIAEISRTALQARRKSTMLVGLNLGNSGTMWTNRSNDEILFSTILGSENKLVTAGLIGVIYSPLRASSGSNGIVNVENNLGFANDKFCALEKGVERLASNSEISVFSKIAGVSQVNCTLMTEIERSLRADSGADPMLCDNGVRCSLPLGLMAEDAKCPENTIVDQAAPSATVGVGGILNPTIEHTCRLCNETSGSYTCTYDYSNGTSSTVTGAIRSLNSDTQLEIIAGLPKPNKCCLQDQSGIRYSYGQKTQQSSSSRPIVFPKDGNPNTDCGFGSAADLTQIGNFCGIKLPIADYKINCTVS